MREGEQHCPGGGCDASEIRSWRSQTTRPPPPPPSLPPTLSLSLSPPPPLLFPAWDLFFFGEGGCFSLIWGKLSSAGVQVQKKIKLTPCGRNWEISLTHWQPVYFSYWYFSVVSISFRLYFWFTKKSLQKIIHVFLKILNLQFFIKVMSKVFSLFFQNFVHFIKLSFHMFSVLLNLTLAKGRISNWFPLPSEFCFKNSFITSPMWQLQNFVLFWFLMY